MIGGYPKPIRKELLDELLKEYSSPEDLLGPDGLLKQLTGAFVGRVLKAELTDHLGYVKDDPADKNTGNSRNGRTAKTLKTEKGDVPIDVPRDRNGTFEPQMVKKHHRHFDGFDDKIISAYAPGMSVREICGHFETRAPSSGSP